MANLTVNGKTHDVDADPNTLCLSEFKLARTDDEVRREMA
jgi:aerobic-type carbon monoxide dehydrogenase small subunit (CoxS/CutS family)